MLKLTLVLVDARLDSDAAQLILTVHDEGDLRVRPAYIEAAKEIIVVAAREVGEKIGVDLPVEISVGRTWADC